MAGKENPLHSLLTEHSTIRPGPSGKSHCDPGIMDVPPIAIDINFPINQNPGAISQSPFKPSHPITRPQIPIAMIVEPPASIRTLRTVAISCDLAVIGGGLSGVCAAITAARAGVKVVLVQDRPVLGGNASSEVRLWILGATSHMGNNNRWAREGGVIDELLVENMHRNPEGNPLVLDTILLEWVVKEPNITLLLNTAVHDLEKTDGDTITRVRAFCSQNSTCYEISAPLFCDASGDGIVGFLAGAAFRIGAEAREEFGELFAAPEASSELLGHTHLLSLEGHRPPGEVHAAGLRAGRHHEDPALARFQGRRLRLPPLVARMGRRARHHPRQRNHQVGALESRLRRLGPHQELRPVPRGGNPHARMGGHHPRQARKPPLRGRSHPHPAGHRRATEPRGRGFLRRLGDRPPPGGRGFQPATRLHPVALRKASIRFPGAASTAATSPTCCSPAASSAPPTSPSAAPA